MSEIVGANVDDLQHLATDFRGAADRFDSARNDVLRAIARTAWQGHTAEQFRAEWNALHAVVMGNLAGDLREAASTVVRNLEDQLRTSGSTGVSAGRHAAWVVGGAGAAALSGLTPKEQRVALIKMGWKDGDAAWDKMTHEEQRAFIESNLKNGELDALPPHARYAINRELVLEEYLRLNELPHPNGAEVARMNLYGDVLKNDRQVLFFDPSGDGRIAVVNGDLSNAQNLAVQVPGISNSMNNFDGMMRDGDSLANQAGTAHTAVVSWLGYDAPKGPADGISPALGVTPAGRLVATGIAAQNGVEYGTDVMARAGATSLNSFVSSLDAQRPDAHITVIGHSYGSLVTGYAAKDGMPADDIVLIGSPGSGVHSASEFSHGGTPPVVHVGYNTTDYVANGSDLSAYGDGAHFGTDPRADSFGADEVHRFEGGVHSYYQKDQLSWMANIVAPTYTSEAFSDLPDPNASIA